MTVFQAVRDPAVRQIRGLGLLMVLLALSGCIVFDDPAKIHQLSATMPFQDNTRLRLVNQTGKSSAELKKQEKCPLIMSADPSSKTYDVFDCRGKDSNKDDFSLGQRFYKIDAAKKIFVTPLCVTDDPTNEKVCFLLPVKIRGRLAFFYFVTPKKDTLTDWKEAAQASGDVALLDRVIAKNRSASPDDGQGGNNKGGDPIVVANLAQLKLVATLIAEKPPEEAQVYTYAIE